MAALLTILLNFLKSKLDFHSVWSMLNHSEGQGKDHLDERKQCLQDREICVEAAVGKGF